MRRRDALLAAWAVCASAVAQRDALPQRNLRMELRWVQSQQRQHSAAAADGGVVVGTGGRVDARGNAVLRAGEQTQGAQLVQQLLVLNGGQASLRLTQAQPVQWLEVGLTPRGPVAVLRQDWTDAGTVVALRPRWPGGRAPVTVQVTHQAVVPSDAGATPAAQGVQTSLQLPLDEWVTVAQAGEARVASERGTLSSRDAAQAAQQLLQMRVSLP